MKKPALGLLIAVAFIIGVWTIAVPESLISDLLVDSVRDSGLELKMEEFNKGLLFSFGANSILIEKSGKPLFRIDRFRARINPLSLLIMKLPLTFSGQVGSGEVKGSVDLLRKKGAVSIDLIRADVGSMPLLSSAGVSGSGTISGSLRKNAENGEIKFVLQDLGLKTASLGGVPVPLDVFTSGRGAITIKTGALHIESFAMEGEGIYARIKGDIFVTAMNLTMELMPEATFRDKGLVLMLLARYKISPGYYVIPVTSNLSF